jgi:hypothetical protein
MIEEKIKLFAPNKEFKQAFLDSKVNLLVNGLDPDFMLAVDLYGDKVRLITALEEAGIKAGFPYLLFELSDGGTISKSGKAFLTRPSRFCRKKHN